MPILHENRSVAQNMVTFMKFKNKLFSLYTLKDRMEYLFRDIIKLKAREIAKMLPVNIAYQELKANTE
jgi:hypothetical protein